MCSKAGNDHVLWACVFALACTLQSGTGGVIGLSKLLVGFDESQNIHIIQLTEGSCLVNIEGP